tara:strand:+ start:13036 stop:14430 length:1395 start_codon:yes stop_codon:yes gene_type:complete
MNDISSERVLPHNIEAEQAVLGALMLDNDIYHKVSSRLDVDHFFDPVHARIFRCIVDRLRTDKLASPVTLRADMEHDEGLSELGGPAYLIRMAHAASFSGIEGTAQVIVEMARRRGVIQVCQDAIERVYDDQNAEVAHAELEIFLHTQEPSDEPRSTSLLAAHAASIEEADMIRKGEITAVPSGLDTLDEAVSFMRGRYTIIGGTTSMGKTATALSIIYNAAREGFGVGFASMEMTEIDLARRMNSIDSRVAYQHQDRPMSEEVFRKVIEAAKLQESLPIEIFNARVNDLASIVSEAKKLKKKYQPNGNFKGLGLLVIDYLQLVKGKGTDFEVLSSAANGLKQVAKLLDVHVIALAQVGTKVMERENARPGLSDMRGSGDLGMAPDNVIFCHRPEYYLERQEKPKGNDPDGWADYTADLEASKNKMELIIAKARMGKLSTVTVNCDMATNRFWDMEPDTQDMGF